MQVHYPGQSPTITIRRVRRVMSGLFIAGCAVSLGQIGNAQSAGQFGAVDRTPPSVCSNRTLRGTYAFNVDGTVLAGPNRLLLRGLAMTRFDGRGNLTQVDFTTINGAPTGTDWRPGDGTYALNPDCTGTMEITPRDGSPTLRLRMVVADHGRTIYNVVEGNATGATGTKVD